MNLRDGLISRTLGRTLARETMRELEKLANVTPPAEHEMYFLQFSTFWISFLRDNDLSQVQDDFAEMLIEGTLGNKYADFKHVDCLVHSVKSYNDYLKQLL